MAYLSLYGILFWSSNTTHVNSARFADPHEEVILATLFHQGAVIAIDRQSGHARTVASNLSKPHDIRPFAGQGWLLSNTEQNQTLILNNQWDIIHRIMLDFDWVQCSALLADGSIVIGTIAAFTTLQSRFFPPIAQLLTTQVDIQGTLALFDRIFEYLDLPIDIQDKPNALQLYPKGISGHISFKNVTFTYMRDVHEYTQDTALEADHMQVKMARPTFSRQVVYATEEIPERLHPTLNHISFDIQPSQLAALVGPSGAGKTTITK